MGALKRAVDMVFWDAVWRRLTSESVQSTSLAFKSVDDIHSCDGFPLGVLGVCDGVTDNVFQENLQYTTGFLVDETGDSLDHHLYVQDVWWLAW